jgi:ribose transport system substrate-binding protein
MVKMLDEIKKAGDGWQAKAAEVPAVLVTKDTVEQFVKDHPDALQ